MSTNVKIALGLAGLAVVLLVVKVGVGFIPSGSGGGGVTPAPNTPFVAPTDPALRTAVAPVTQALAGSDYADDIAFFYKQLAARISAKANSAQQAREMNNLAGKELQEINANATYHPQLQAVLEGILDEFVGKSNNKFADADRAKVAAVFNAIAWAAYEARGGFFSPGSAPIESSLAPGIGWDFGSARRNIAATTPMPENTTVIKTDDDKELCVETGLHGVTHDMSHGLIVAPFESQNEGGQDDNGERYFYQLPPPDGEADDLVGQDPIDPDSVDPSFLITHGLVFDEEEAAEFNRENFRFGDLGLPQAVGETRLLYRALKLLDTTAYESEKQTTGDCTSHATRNACDTSRAYEILVKGDHEDFVARGATEPIYGYRGHSGAGMSVYRAAKWVNEVGGFAIRRNYEGIVDLSVYNSNTGTRWGGSGPPRALVEQISPNKMLSSVSINSIDEARDSICNGYAIIVGSGYSFSPKRDQYGFAARTPQGWSHAMAWIATAPMKDLIPGNDSDEPCFLIANSWGTWNSGPKGKYDIPNGSFWIKPDIARGMIGQNQAIAVGNFQGFTPKPLTDWGFDYLSSVPVNPSPSGYYNPEIAAIIAVSLAESVLTGSARFDVTTPDSGGGGGGKGRIVLPDGSVVIYEEDMTRDFGPSIDIDPLPPTPEPEPVIDLNDPEAAAEYELLNPNDIVVNGTPEQRPAPYFSVQGTYVLPGIWQESTPDGNWGLYKKVNGEWRRVSSSEFPQLDGKLPKPSRFPLGKVEELTPREDGNEQAFNGTSNLVEPWLSSARSHSELDHNSRWLEDPCYHLAC